MSSAKNFLEIIDKEIGWVTVSQIKGYNKTKLKELINHFIPKFDFTYDNKKKVSVNLLISLIHIHKRDSYCTYEHLRSSVSMFRKMRGERGFVRFGTKESLIDELNRSIAPFEDCLVED